MFSFVCLFHCVLIFVKCFFFLERKRRKLSLSEVIRTELIDVLKIIVLEGKVKC